MMKVFIWLILTVGLFGQYSSNFVTDPGFDTAGLWGNTGGWNVAAGVATIDNDDGLLFESAEVSILDATPYRAIITVSNYTDGTLRIRHSGSVYTEFDATENGIIVCTFITSNTYTNCVLSSADNATLTVDDFYYRQKLDTLYTDPAQADETDNDSTKTLAEAFEVRGSHSGGYFITTAGTYSENITMDSSFTKWEASGAAIVTSVNFNSVTCAVDLANLTITTKLNDENVTYLNDYIYHGYKDYKKNIIYGGYK